MKEKLEREVEYGECPRGQSGSPKKGVEQGDHRTGVGKLTVRLKKPRKEATCSLSQSPLFYTDTGTPAALAGPPPG